MNFNDELGSKIQQIERIILDYLPQEEGYAKTVLEAMNYSVLAGGKRIRPLLMGEVFQMFGGNSKIIEPFQCAIEMIHTYSLVHDDLPAMDNDEYRRGRKTTHIVYGEAMAILAGDALLNYAFETACKAFEIEPENKNIPKALQVLAKKAGIFGMIGGQTADIESENCPTVTMEKLLYIHKNKTAALIESSMMIGAILAGCKEEKICEVEMIAHKVGLAFQIQDDILDETSTLEILGKEIGSDRKNEKTTYLTLVGIEQAKSDVKELTEDAISIYQGLGCENSFLKALLLQLITREK